MGTGMGEGVGTGMSDIQIVKNTYGTGTCDIGTSISSVGTSMNR